MINELKIDEMIKQGCLVTAGNINDYNTMTIGWGMIGTIWRKKTFIVYVKPCRYTYEFMEKNDYFTVSFYDKKYIKEIGYLGSKSGRAYCTFVCKKYYYTDINKDNVPNEDINRYYLTEEPHRVYYGEIVEVIEKTPVNGVFYYCYYYFIFLSL